MLEVLIALLWGAAIFGGQNALGSILSNSSFAQMCVLFASCRDRTSLRDNCDLQKALLEMLLAAFQVTTATHIKALPENEQVRVNTWLCDRSEYLNRFIRNRNKIQQPVAINLNWNLLLGASPEELASLTGRQRSRELQALKQNIEESIGLSELPPTFRYNFQQDWLPCVNLYLALAIKTNRSVEEFLLLEFQRHVLETLREAQTAVQHIRWLFNNPQNFLLLVQVIDFDLEALRQGMRDLAGQKKEPQGIVEQTSSLLRPDKYLAARDSPVDKVLELLEDAQTKDDLTSASNGRDRYTHRPGFANAEAQGLRPAKNALPTIPQTTAAPDLKSSTTLPSVIAHKLKSSRESPLGVSRTIRCLHTLTGHSDSVVSVAFSPRANILASASWDKSIKIWQLGPNGDDPDSAVPLLRTLTEHSASVYSVAFSPRTHILASGSWDKTIKIWQLEASQLPIALTGHSVPVYSVAFNPRTNILASGSGDETIKLWQLGTGKLLSTLGGHSSFVYSVAFSPDGQLLASGSADRTIKIWDAATGQLLRTLLGNSPVTSVAFSSDGQTLVCACTDETIKLWHLEPGELGADTRPAPTRTLTGHSGEVLSVAVSPRLPILASGSYDKTIKLWQLETGNLICTLTGHYDSVLSVAFSPDGHTLASGSHDKTIKIWRRF